ncbi:MAG: hypothetical protein ACP5US_01875 [Candidatus Kryptoniota bacterium]
MAKKKPPKVPGTDDDTEFKLLVERFNDPLSKRSGVAFVFRTREEFQNFSYDLVIRHHREKNTIYFDIAGLKPPAEGFPGSGYAVCRCEYENLPDGEYVLVIDRRGKRINEFKISIGERIEVRRETRERKFITLVTERQKWLGMGELK